MKSHKTLIGGFIFISAVLLFISLVHSSKFLNRTTFVPVHADQEKVNLTMTPKTGTFDTKPQQITILIQPQQSDKKISGLDLTFKASGVLKIVDISKPTTFPDGNSNVFSQIASTITDQQAHISYVVVQNDTLLPQAIKLQVTVAATTFGIGQLQVNKNSMQIVGKIAGYVFGAGTIDQGEFTFTGAANLTAIPSTESLTVRVKLQGVKKIAPQSKQISVQVALINQQTKNQYTYMVPVTYDGFAFWSGNVAISAPPGNSYIALVKGPIHLQKKICDLVITSVVYKCLDSHTFSISQKENILDLTTSPLIVGDLQIEGSKKDGAVSVVDLTFIKNHIGQTSEEIISEADLNFDGVVDSQDYSLALSALGHKADE